MYGSATINDRMLGHGEPVRVRSGQRVLFRLLNASATERVDLALAGHRFQVIALDGNPVPTAQTVDVLELAPAERVDAIVEMNRPGVWILGAVDDDDRAKGLGIVVEYADASGQPQWLPPPKATWDYTVFGTSGPAQPSDERIELKFEKVAGGHGGYNRWTINGKSWPDTNPLFTVRQGRRYRLAMRNESGDFHPVHLHRHNFELVKIADKPTAGIQKDTVNLSRFSSVEVDFVADQPGPTLFHCHQQDHQDEGFMGLIAYE
ncbi:MAG: multicopper oxidase domain-containing protein, partial [Alphaproteobacteria bacterium]|nr:multicopper oxidase domain-containing protein [Alphaproteobacteria bacterium]